MPSNTVISVLNLSKQYTIKHQSSERYSTLRDTIAQKVKSIASSFSFSSHPVSEDFWALKDVSFEIKQGERIGIIGKNGAGKSTLLKILSRITSPTAGQIVIEGRVASLLEVGTGFHPELTGRENIFLNGSILGMTKNEIKKNFDEIVNFAEIEKFLDTPVKRFSSGMYVRLAFAVAAHLNSEILIVDEVLAVGDAEFQKKCLGKMKNVANEGKTILLVSHNMAAIQNLCSRVLYLSDGSIIKSGDTKSVMDKYILDGLTSNTDLSSIQINNHQLRRGNGSIRFNKISISDKNNQKKNQFFGYEEIYFHISCKVFTPVEEEVHCSVYLKTPQTNEIITHTESHRFEMLENAARDKTISFTIIIYPEQIRPGIYNLYFWIGSKAEGGAYDIIDGFIPPIVIKSPDEKAITNHVGFFNLKSEIRIHE